MFPAAIRRLTPSRLQSSGFLHGGNHTNYHWSRIAQFDFRSLSSFQGIPPNLRRSCALDDSSLGARRMQFSPSMMHHSGIRTRVWLYKNHYIHNYQGFRQQQLRSFSDEKPNQPPQKLSEDSGGLSKIVPALRQRVTYFNTGDLMSVYAIAILILVVVFSPFIASQMRKSDNEYEEIEADDPVAHTEKNYRRLFQEAQLEQEFLVRLWEGRLHEPPRKPRIVKTSLDVISELCDAEELHAALAHLLSSVLLADEFQNACHVLIKNLWHDLVNDPETIEQVVQLLHNAIQNQEIHGSIRKLVFQIINDKEVYDELVKLLVRLGQDEEVLRATQGLLTESAHNALNDPEILDHSMEFATDVVGDDVVQRTSGEALRNTVTYAVRPGLSTFLSLVGVALVLFGLSALANSRASDQEAAILEKAMSTFARNIQKTAVEGFSTVFSLPGRLLSACLSVLSAMVTVPLKVIHEGFVMVGKSGDAILRAVGNAMITVVQFPLKLIMRGCGMVVKSAGTTLSAIAGVLRYLASLPSSLLRASHLSIMYIGKLTADRASRAFRVMWGTASAICIGIGSAFVSCTSSCLKFIWEVSSNSTSSIISSALKGVERCDRWIEHVYDSVALASTMALNSVVNVAKSGLDASIEFVVQMSDTIMGWASQLLKLATSRGRDDTSSNAV